MNQSRVILLAVALGLFIPSSFSQQEDKPISEQLLGTWKHQTEPGSMTIQADGKSRVSLAGGRFVEIFPDGIVRGCEVEKLWHVSKIGAVSGNGLDIVDIVMSKQAKEFQKIAKKCTRDARSRKSSELLYYWQYPNGFSN